MNHTHPAATATFSLTTHAEVRLAQRTGLSAIGLRETLAAGRYLAERPPNRRQPDDLHLVIWDGVMGRAFVAVARPTGRDAYRVLTVKSAASIGDAARALCEALYGPPALHEPSR